MSYSIRILKYGTQLVPGPQVYFQSGWDERVNFDFFVFLIQGEGVTAVVDCGMDDSSAINALIASSLGPEYLIATRPDRRGVAELLDAEGVSLDAVDYVALTHFHSDHVANVAIFPRARILVSAAGWAALQDLRMRIPQMVADPVFPTSAINYVEELLEQRVDLMPDGETPLPGVTIKHVGGHTADSAAFTVPTGEGRVLIPGDTIWTYSNLWNNIPVGSAVNVQECFETMSWARESGDIVLPTHDPLVLERHPRGIHA